MLLILIRHALADEQDPAKYPDDTVRPLVPKGRRRHRRAMERLARAGFEPTHVLSSPASPRPSGSGAIRWRLRPTSPPWPPPSAMWAPKGRSPWWGMSRG
jgi:hypothetical protein